MKASKLIEELQKLISEHGDLEVLKSDKEDGNVPVDEIYYETIPCLYDNNEPPAFVILSL